MSRAITRRNMVKGAAAVAALVTLPALPVAASGDPIITLCADAIRAGRAWNRACTAYSRASDAATDAGMPGYKPEPVMIGQKSDAVIREAMSRALVTVGERDGIAPDVLDRLKAEAERDRIPAERAERARALRSARAYRTELARWEEADARFGITAAQEASDRAGAVAYAAIEAVEAATIASVPGAFVVAALAHFLIDDGDTENGAAMLAKVRAYLDRSGILGDALPSLGQEGGDA